MVISVFLFYFILFFYFVTFVVKRFKKQVFFINWKNLDPLEME